MMSNDFKVAPAFIITPVVFLFGCLLLLNSQAVKASCAQVDDGHTYPPKNYRYPAVVNTTVQLLTQPNASGCNLIPISSGSLVYVLLESSRASGWVVIGQHSSDVRGYLPKDKLRRIPESAIGQFVNKRRVEDRNLKNFESQRRLKSYQRILNRLGYAPGPIDGILGSQTIRAVTQFQRDNDLTVDGIIGPKTRAALKIADKAKSRNPLIVAGSLKDIQSKLKQLGFDPGPIDGLPGPRTTAAIVQFQRSRNLVADGIVGPITMQALVSG